MLITLEGGEGSGKTTQIRLLHHWLQSLGYPVTMTREPGGTPTGQGIREVLLDPDLDPCPQTELLLFYAARAQLIRDVVRPGLAAGQIILLDRYVDSSLVYQGFARGLPMEFIHDLNRHVVGDCWPDLTLLLDLPVALGLTRAGQRGDLNRLDQADTDFHQRVRQGFLEQARLDPTRWHVVDASQNTSAVQEHLRQVIRQAITSP